MNQQAAQNIARRFLGNKKFASAENIVVDTAGNVYTNCTADSVKASCGNADTFVVKGSVDLSVKSKKVKDNGAE